MPGAAPVQTSQTAKSRRISSKSRGVSLKRLVLTPCGEMEIGVGQRSQRATRERNTTLL